MSGSCKGQNLELFPYGDTWEEGDPNANFKAEVALLTVQDPLPTLEVLSRNTGIPVPCLVRYILVKWAASAAEAYLHIGPIALEQMRQHIARAEAAGSDNARLEAYEALKGMIDWLSREE